MIDYISTLKYSIAYAQIDWIFISMILIYMIAMVFFEDIINEIEQDCLTNLQRSLSVAALAQQTFNAGPRPCQSRSTPSIL